MSPRDPDHADLLRWYPAQWRARYGGELGALIEDTLEGRPATRRFRLGIARAGLRERGHQGGLIGSTAPAAERARAGALLVLCAWTAFVVAGSAFVKISEGFKRAIPAGSRVLSSHAIDALQVLVAVGGLLVLIGATVAVPSFVRFLREGGWPSIRRQVLGAVAASVVATAALVGLVAVAHTLTFAQRNGASWPYSLAAIVTALLVAAALTLWTAVAVSTTRRLDLGSPVLAAEAVLAAGVAAAIALMTIGTALWWGGIASSAPWFLHGPRTGSGTSAFDPRLAAAMVLMLAATVVAAYGVNRVVHSWRELRVG